MKAETYARLRKLENDIDLYHTAYDSLCKVMLKEKNSKSYLQTATQLSAQLLMAKGEYAELQRSLIGEDKVNNLKQDKNEANISNNGITGMGS